tara:strand:- start:263 stop:646 length:384 start_codon:yes stop_codon:yes gene_type:complete
MPYLTAIWGRGFFMDYLKLLTTLNLDLNNGNTGSVKFFRTNIYSIFIWFQVLIYYYQKENLTTELLLKEKFLSNISRPTVFKIIDNAVVKGYLSKVINEEDHRKFNILPSKVTVSEYEEWAQIYKGY